MDPPADFGQCPGVGMYRGGVALAGDGDRIRSGAGKIVAEVVERLGFRPGHRDDRLEERRVAHPLPAVGDDVDGMRSGDGGGRVRHPGGDEDRDEVILEHAEVTHINSGQEPEVLTEEAVPGGEKVEVAPRFVTKIVRHRVVQDRRDVGDTAVDAGAGCPEPAAEEKSIVPDKICHTTE